MPQIQTIEQEQKLQQRLTAQKMLRVHLLVMPLAQLEAAVGAELGDNPALETCGSGGATPACDTSEGGLGAAEDGTFGAEAEGYGEEESGGNSIEGNAAAQETETVKEERGEALSQALSTMTQDDDMPPVGLSFISAESATERESDVYGNSKTFQDSLFEEIAMLHLSDKELKIMRYVVFSLGDDGFLKKDNATIADEMAIYGNLDTSEEEVSHIVSILQTLDPAGIGAHSVQEALELQLQRLPAKGDKTVEAAKKVVSLMFDDFMHNRWERIKERLRLSDLAATEVKHCITRLNPKPAAALGASISSRAEQITPDVFIETTDDGRVRFYLNQEHIPELSPSASFQDLVERVRLKGEGASRQEREAAQYAKDRLERARMFVDAIKQRNRTISLVVGAITKVQRQWFFSGRESDLKPMTLRTVAQMTGLDKSTVSRVNNSKWCDTEFGIFPLRHFFMDKFSAEEDTHSGRTIRAALKNIVDKEDKQEPLTDEAIRNALKAIGYPLSRRTVAKYRQQEGIPTARMRRG